MPKTRKYVFYGDIQKASKKRYDDAPEKPEPYVASPELIEAVNLSIYIQRPLLLEGEAGCGKTRLARAIAYELGLPFYTWYVRSISKAQEGLYSYDAILRLHDVHVQKSLLMDEQNKNLLNEKNKSWPRNPQNPKHYRMFGPLGKAFELKECPAVVLIDEIDKADVDFPNDLLTVLDDPWKFYIPETDELIKASHKPIVIITSNKEKGNLPAPFLRRCIYHYITFPDEKRLEDIINVHFKIRENAFPSSGFIKKLINHFFNIRKAGDLHKNPGTSEFLDWLEALWSFDFGKNKKDIELDPTPFPGLLFKLRSDWRRKVREK